MSFDVDVHIYIYVCVCVSACCNYIIYHYMIVWYVFISTALHGSPTLCSSILRSMPCPSSDLKSTELPQSHVEAVMWCRPLATFRKAGSPKAAKLDHLVMDHDLAMTRPNMDDIHYSKQHISGSSLPKMNDLVLWPLKIKHSKYVPLSLHRPIPPEPHQLTLVLACPAQGTWPGRPRPLPRRGSSVKQIDLLWIDFFARQTMIKNHK